MSQENPLFDFSAQGNNPELEKLIADGINIHEQNHEGNNALLIAAMNGHARTVQILLDAGSNVYSTNNSGHNPLIVAAMMCHSDVVKIILEFTKKASDRKSPSIVAVMAANSLEAQGCKDVAELLRTNPG